MTTQRRSTGNRLAGSTSRLAVKKIPSRQFPVQRKIRNLEDELNAFNERIAELESEGHRGHAMDVLKANAIDLARQIDELRCLLVVPTKKGEPS
jgi:hypothetical protein